MSESGLNRAESKCSVCLSEHREAVDEAVRLLRSESSIASQFGLSKAAVNRHKRHSAAKAAASSDPASRKAELQALFARERDPKVKSVLSRELRALEEHEIRIQQEAGVDKPLAEQPGFQTFLTHLLNAIGECEQCRSAVLEAVPPGDTRSG